VLRHEVFQEIILLELLYLMRNEIIEIVNFSLPRYVAFVDFKNHEHNNFPDILVLSDVMEHVHPKGSHDS